MAAKVARGPHIMAADAGRGERPGHRNCEQQRQGKGERQLTPVLSKVGTTTSLPYSLLCARTQAAVNKHCRLLPTSTAGCCQQGLHCLKPRGGGEKNKKTTNAKPTRVGLPRKRVGAIIRKTSHMFLVGLIFAGCSEGLRGARKPRTDARSWAQPGGMQVAICAAIVPWIPVSPNGSPVPKRARRTACRPNVFFFFLRSGSVHF